MSNGEDESTLLQFLDLIEQDMLNNPKSITPISERVLDEIAWLTEGVDTSAF